MELWTTSNRHDLICVFFFKTVPFNKPEAYCQRLPSDGPRAPGTISLDCLLLPPHTDRSGSSQSGLSWITALLCFTLSLYLYFCQIWCLHCDVSFLLLSILCVLPSFRLNCMRYSVSSTCKMFFFCSALYTWHLLHVCLFWKRILLCGSSWGFFHCCYFQ